MKKALYILMATLMAAIMCVSAFAAEFVPSIEAKTAPEVGTFEGEEEGVTYNALIVDDNGDLVEGAADGTILEFFVLPESEKDEAVLDEIKENIDNAMEQIEAAEDLGKLAENLEEDIQGAIDKAFSATPDAADKPAITDLVISDVFDASLVRDRGHIEELKPGQKARFKIKPNFAKGTFFVILHNTKDNAWEVVNDYEWTDDGFILVTVDHLSAFALAVNKKDVLPVDPEGPDSPKTDVGVGFKVEYIIVAVTFIGAAVFFFSMAKRRREF